MSLNDQNKGQFNSHYDFTFDWLSEENPSHAQLRLTLTETLPKLDYSVQYTNTVVCYKVGHHKLGFFPIYEKL